MRDTYTCLIREQKTHDALPIEKRAEFVSDLKRIEPNADKNRFILAYAEKHFPREIADLRRRGMDLILLSA